MKRSDLISGLDSSTTYVSEDIFNKLKLSTHIPYKINVGLQSQETLLKPIKEKNTLYLSSHLIQELLLIEGIKTNIWLKDKSLYLGPVIGMFVRPRLIERMKEGFIPNSIDLFSKANQEVKTFLYFFSINQIDWTSQKINGYVYVPLENEWKSYDLPFPSIIHDQCSGYKKSDKELIENARKQFKEVYRIPFINHQNALGKHDLYQQLYQFPEMREYLPKTVEYRNFIQVMKALNAYSLIFLKAFQGSRGETIMSIKKNNNNYVAFYYGKGKMKKRIIRSKYALKRMVETFISGKKYVIQQGISLIKYEGHKMDVRVLLQKNQIGIWETSGMFANIAFKDSTITNYYEGKGVIYKELYPKLKEHTKNVPSFEEISARAVFFAKYIEKGFGDFGELGMDIAIDQEGKIWFIEANTMPDRYVGYIEETEQESITRFSPLLEYSKFLMGCDNND